MPRESHFHQLPQCSSFLSITRLQLNQPYKNSVANLINLVQVTHRLTWRGGSVYINMSYLTVQNTVFMTSFILFPIILHSHILGCQDTGLLYPMSHCCLLSWSSLCRPDWPLTQKSASPGIKGMCHLAWQLPKFLITCRTYYLSQTGMKSRNGRGFLFVCLFDRQNSFPKAMCCLNF